MNKQQDFKSSDYGVDFGSLAKLFSEGQNTRILAAKQQDEINNAKLLSQAIKLNTSKDNNIDLNKALFDYTNAGGNPEQGLKTLLGLHPLNTHEPTMEEKFAQSLALFKAKEELTPNKDNKDKPNQQKVLIESLLGKAAKDSDKMLLANALTNLPEEDVTNAVTQSMIEPDWGHSMRGALAGAGTGAALGSLASPIGSGIGAGIGLVGGAIAPWMSSRHLNQDKFRNLTNQIYQNQ